MGLVKQKRSVSAPRHIKCYMRASLGQNRLAGLTMMAVHSSHAQQVDTRPGHPAELQAKPWFCQSVMTGIHLTLRRTCHQHACFVELLVLSVGFVFLCKKSAKSRQ